MSINEPPPYFAHSPGKRSESPNPTAAPTHAKINDVLDLNLSLAI